jgi:hypothetical protein
MGSMKDLLGDTFYESRFPQPSPQRAFDGSTS